MASGDDNGKEDGLLNRGIAHHEFPQEIYTSDSRDAQKARDLLADISFDIESTGNKIVVFADSGTGEQQAGRLGAMQVKSMVDVDNVENNDPAVE